MSEIMNEKSKYILTPINAKKFRSGPALKSGFSTLGNLSRKLFIVTATALALVSGFFVTNIQNAEPAHADWVSDAFCEPIKNANSNYGWGSTQTTPETNLTGFFGVVIDYATNDRKLTAYEKYGTTGTNYTTWYSAAKFDVNGGNENVTYTNPGNGSTFNLDVPKDSPYWALSAVDCMGITGALENGIANFLLSFSEWGVSVINTVYMVAFFGSNVIFTGMYVIITGIVSNFRTSLYLPFITIFVMLGALWMAWQGLVKRRSTEAFNGALWMIGSVIAGTLLLANPSVVPRTADFIVAKATEGIAGTITDGASRSVDTVLCSVDQYLVAKDPTVSNLPGDVVVDAEYNIADHARRMQCAIWYNLVYVPWVVGQYGVSPHDASDRAYELLSTDPDNLNPEIATALGNMRITMGNDEPLALENMSWPIVQLNVQSLNIDLLELNHSQRNQYVKGGAALVAYHELADNQNFTWSGKIAAHRITVASASVFATVATGILILIFGFSMLAYQITMLLLVLLMPFFLLAGVHPGAGRRIAMRWVELLINVTIKRIMISVLLSAFLLLYALVMGSGVWLIQNILVLAITIVGLRYRGKIMNLFADVQLGGDRRFGLGGGEGQGGGGFRRVAGAVTGAVVGGAAAAIGAGALSSTVGTATASVVGGAVAPAAAGGAGTAVAAGTTAAAAGGASTAAVGAAGAAGAAAEAAGAAGAAVAPAVAPAVTKSTAEAAAAQAARVAELKSKAIRQGAIQGAAQGFAGGVQGATLGAAMTGMQAGDIIHDNEIQRIENEKREARDLEGLAAQQRQAEAIERLISSNSQKSAEVQAEEAKQRAIAEWNAKRSSTPSSTAAYDNYDGSLPPRPETPAKFKSEEDYEAAEAAELERRRQQLNQNNLQLPPRNEE